MVLIIKTMNTKLVFVLVLGLGLLQAHSSTADDAITAEGQAPSSATNTQDTKKDTTNNAKETEAAHDASETGTPSTHSHVSTDNDDTQTTPTAPNDQNPENITGMSDSLVDYVLDLLKHSNKSSTTPGGKNATQPEASETGPAATQGGSKDSNMSPTETGGGGREAEGTGSSSAAGQGGSDAEAVNSTAAPPKNKTPDTDTKEKGGDKSGHDQWSDNEDFTTPKPSIHNTTTKRIKVDCNKEVDLQDYCGFTLPAWEYFHNRTDVEGLRAPFIDMDIVYDLMACPRGEWCLDNKLNVFKAMQVHFYAGPMCDDSMWKCIFDVILLRGNCRNDGEFLFVVDGMDLLCNLPSDNAFTPQNPSATKDQSRCFAHVLAALHVTYADFLANNGLTPPEKDASCEGHGFRMSETFLCADNNCKGQFEARRAMEGFERWSWFMSNLDNRVKNCEALASDTCGHLQGAAPRPSSWFDMTTFTPFWMTTTEVQSGGGAGHTGVFGEEDKSLMIALTVGTAVGLLFIMLGLLFWRRSRSRSAYYYRSLSDSLSEKGPSDEAHLLGRSTD